MSVLPAILGGLTAGLAVAVPPGPLAALLVREGMTRGTRAAAPAAAGVAVVDTAYCAAAVGAGAWAGPWVAGVGTVPRIVAGAVLLVIAAVGLLGDVRGRQVVALTGTQEGRGRSARRFAVFAGLTAINPSTLVSFAAVAAGMPRLLAVPTAAVVFVLGAGSASLAWQLLLVASAGSLGARLTARARDRIGALGHLVMGALGVAVLLDVVR